MSAAKAWALRERRPLVTVGAAGGKRQARILETEPCREARVVARSQGQGVGARQKVRVVRRAHRVHTQAQDGGVHPLGARLEPGHAHGRVPGGLAHEAVALGGVGQALMQGDKARARASSAGSARAALLMTHNEVFPRRRYKKLSRDLDGPVRKVVKRGEPICVV